MLLRREMDSGQLLTLYYTLTQIFSELFPIVLALEIWVENLKNKCVTLHSDNYAVVHIINRQTSKDPDIMVLVRRLVLICMRLNLLVRSVHNFWRPEFVT